MISELTEELERWKTEVREYRQERVMVDTWRKQISDLERDLEVALETLQTAEGKVIETKAEKNREIQMRLVEHQAIVDKLQAEVEKEKLGREKALQEKERSEQQKAKIEELESLKQGTFTGSLSSCGQRTFFFVLHLHSTIDAYFTELL